MTKTWLVLAEHQRLTPNRYSVSEQKPELIKPIEAIVYHYTAGGFNSSLVALTSPITQVSAHFLVDRDGTVWQLAPLEDRTWHAGGKTSKLFGTSNVNGRTLGIEIVNWGKLEKQDSKWHSWTGVVIPDAEVLVDPHGVGWHRYPEKQIDGVADLTKKLQEKFPILKKDTEKRLTGHETVDPTRKSDPGFAWPWHRIRQIDLSPTP